MRETLDQIIATLSSTRRALDGRESLIDIQVNGNPALSRDIANYLHTLDREVKVRQPIHIRLWDTPTQDKAMSWNQYIHEIRPESRLSFFIDGYVQPDQSAFQAIAEALENSHDDTLAATGVPTVGRHAEADRDEMIREGGLHGNLHAIKLETLQGFADRGCRLPLGLYRVDAVIGAAIMLGLNPTEETWNPKRVLVVEEATWTRPVLSPVRWPHIKTHLSRKLKQAQGRIENQAIRRHFAIDRRSIGSLPKTNYQLLNDWVHRFPEDSRQLFRWDPLCRLAFHRLSDSHDWSPEATSPRLITEVDLPSNDMTPM